MSPKFRVLSLSRLQLYRRANNPAVQLIKLLLTSHAGTIDPPRGVVTATTISIIVTIATTVRGAISFDIFAVRELVCIVALLITSAVWRTIGISGC